MNDASSAKKKQIMDISLQQIYKNFIQIFKLLNDAF